MIPKFLGEHAMIKYLTFLVLFAASTGLALAQTKTEPAKAPAPLTLTVRTDRQSYRLTEELKMEILLKNDSNEDIYIWGWDLCWNPARGLSMHITARDGKPVTGDFFLDCVPPPPREGYPYAFIRIEAGQFHGRADTFKVKDLINRPGEFDVEVTYNSFLSDEFIREFLAKDPIAKLPVWTMEKPVITATKVHVIVTK